MALRIKLKNSVVQDRVPTTSDLPEVGELAVNANINSIGGFMRASDNSVVKIFGPGSLSTPTATTSVSGISELATNSETTTGTATNRVVTPAGLNAVTVAERTTSNTNYVAKSGSTLTGVLTMPNGSNSAPAINFGDSDSGIFGGTNTVSLAAGGTTRLTADTGVDITGTLAVTGAITSTSDLTVAEKVIHAGDTDTFLSFPAANTVSVETAGSEALRVDSSQRLLVGTSTSRSIGTTTNRKILVEATDASAGIGLLRNTANSLGSYVSLGKTRGGSNGSNTIVQADDTLGIIHWVGADGTDVVSVAAEIRAQVDGTPGADDMPGRLLFSTTADGAASPTARMTIKADGKIGIGTTSPLNELVIDKSGSAANCKLEISQSGGGGGTSEILFSDAVSGRGRIFYDHGSNPEGIKFEAAGTQTLIVTTGGRIGIGTTSPAEELVVRADAPSIQLESSNASGRNYGFQANNDGKFHVYDGTAGVNRLTMDSSGRVLVGQGHTTGNGEPLLSISGNTQGASGAGQLFLRRGLSTSIIGGNIGADLGEIKFGDLDGGVYASIQVQTDATAASNDYPARIMFKTTADGASSPTERMRIDSSGNVNIPNDSGKLQIGASQDLQIYHDGVHSRVVDTGTGNLILQGSIVNFQNVAGTENMIKATQNGAVELYHDNSTKFETTSNGVQVTGRYAFNGSNYIDCNTTANTMEFFVGGGQVGEFNSSGFTFLDNKRARFGTGNDLQIYHDGSHSYIKNSTNYTYYLSTQHHFKNAADNELQAKFGENAGVELYYDNSKKLEVFTWGVEINGDLGLDDNRKVALGNGPDFLFYHDGSTSLIQSASHPLAYYSNTRHHFLNGDGSENMAVFVANGASELYYDGSKKFFTYSDGVHIDTGTLRGDDNSKIALGDKTNGDLQIYHDGTDSRIKNHTGKLILSGDTIELCRLQDDSIGLRVVMNGATQLSHAFAGRLITTSGGITVTGTVTETSDIAMKKDIEDLTYGLDIIKQLKPRKYKFTNEGNVDTVDIGFVAQEVETVIPEIVKGEEGSKGVSYGHFSSVLTKALQEAILKIETLETKVAALEAA